MPGRILIADDVATNRIVLKVKLSAASYDVFQAATGRDLMAAAGRDLPDLIILDGNFEYDHGIDYCHDLKENPKTATIPVMIIATDFSPADRLAALHAGACDVVSKPLDDIALLALVRNSMRIRGIEEELRLRESTAIELGFQEPTVQFNHPAQILVVNGPQIADLEWRPPFEVDNPCTVHLIGHSRVLDTISHKKMTPDIILIPSCIHSENDGLFLLAELRNSPQTRHSAIIVLDNSDRGNAAITALDMGANDVMIAHTPPAEFAFRLGRQLHRKKKADQLRDTLADGLRLAVTDPLTGLFNRRYAFPHMSRIAKKSNAAGSPFAVMVLDLDHFKRINDTCGHAVGDHVLKEVARRLKANVRAVDLIARIGGEEFLVVMPDTDLNAARLAAERLRRVTEVNPITIPDRSNSISVTTSIGVSICGANGKVDATIEAMVDRADHALLGAKSTGRNQVRIEKSAA